MNTREELDAFVLRADELIQSSYILADIKIVNLLKAIAASKTILAIFENCISGFDFEEACKKYLVKSKYLAGDKGEFVLPSTTRELLAFVFYVLVKVDDKSIDLAEFINKYFYVDGSFSAGYHAFIKAMIIPMRDSVKTLTESVIEGKLQNPVEALKEEETRREKEKEENAKKAEIEAEIQKKGYADSVKKIKAILLTDKVKIKSSKRKDAVKNEMLLIVDMLANVITSGDGDAIEYAFTAYKYLAKAHPFSMCGRVRKIGKLLEGVYREL